MSKTIHVEISEKPLSIQAACDFVMDDEHGAIDTFIGAVRNHHQGQAVQGMTYDVHKGLAETTFSDICLEAQGFWPNTKYYVSHFQGELDIGGVSVVIAVSAAHRGDTFDACRYVIEELKKRSPIWKKEHYPSGKSEWLPGHSLNDEADVNVSCCGKCGG